MAIGNPPKNGGKKSSNEMGKNHPARHILIKSITLKNLPKNLPKSTKNLRKNSQNPPKISEKSPKIQKSPKKSTEKSPKIHRKIAHKNSQNRLRVGLEAAALHFRLGRCHGGRPGLGEALLGEEKHLFSPGKMMLEAAKMMGFTMFYIVFSYFAKPFLGGIQT